ncbi:hypothetical protein [Nostoc commune]|uniref:hypothetical protein n=1 Tax=Nostoc commune TaxID=1178 RepID=UPI0015E82B76|nr:hypothetical protein [Nostoc commune]
MNRVSTRGDRKNDACGGLCLRFFANSANIINWRKCRKPPSARRLTNRDFNLDD